MLGNECDLKTNVRISGIHYPLYLKIAAENHLFQGLRNLTANLMAYVFGTKH